MNNCTLYNQTQQSVGIHCIPGYDGGLPQMFVLELFSIKTDTIRYVLILILVQNCFINFFKLIDFLYFIFLSCSSIYLSECMLRRYNFTNVDEPNFYLESLDLLNTLMTNENNSLRAFVYSINQKGRSQTIVIPELIIGSLTSIRGL